MIRRNFKTVLTLALASHLVFFGCATQPEQNSANEEMMAEIEEMETGGTESAPSEEVSEFGAEDLSTEEEAIGGAEEETVGEFGEEEFGEEEFAGEDFSEETFGEETLAQEEPLAEPAPVEEPLLEEPIPEAAPQEPSVVQNEEMAPFVQIQGIDFVTNNAGGTVQVKTSGPADYTTRYNADTSQFVIEIKNGSLAEGLTRPYIMKDFKTPFGAINAYQNPGSTTARIVVQMKEPGEPMAQQEGNTILLVAPNAGTVPTGTVAEGAAPAEDEAWKQSYNVAAADKDEKILGAQSLDEFLTGSSRFYGRPISIQAADADVREILNFIADEGGANVIISEDVQGKISMKLRNIPWDQALVIVMRSRGLGYIRQGNVIRITKLETLQAESRAAKEILDTQAKLTPIKVKVIPVSYADPKEVTEQLKPFLNPERGKVVADERTSSIIVTDTADVLSRVERLVQELDLPPAQVMIEGKIVEATEDFSRNLGVNWGFSGVPVELADKGGFQGNPIRLTTTYNSTSINNANLQTLNSVLSLNIGTLDFFGNLDARLGLAQSDNLVKIISSPRVVTMNRAQAEISQKGEVIFVSRTVDVGGNTTTQPQKKDVELKLTVTPQITAEGSVILDVNVFRQFAGALADQETGDRPVNTRSAKTKVLVPNGQTAVIGGIYQSDEATNEQGVPGLKDIPIFGWLFKSRFEQRIKNELLIFLTPRILNAKEQGVAGG